MEEEEEEVVGVGQSESDLATGHGVAQLGLVVDEGHDAQVGLDPMGVCSISTVQAGTPFALPPCLCTSATFQRAIQTLRAVL